MLPKDFDYTKKNVTIAKAIKEFDYDNFCNGLQTPSQISKIIEIILLRVPLPQVWADHKNEEFFAHSYILSAVQDFQTGKFKIKNLTGAFPDLVDLTFEELSNDKQRLIDETTIDINILTIYNQEILTEVKKFILETVATKYYIVG